MKSRNREINIFNMSLLDILCGALGAFCFLTLVLFPYYSPDKGAAKKPDAPPPAADPKNYQEALDRVKELEDALKKFQDYAAQLDAQDKRLEAQNRQLQGDLKTARDRNEQLEMRKPLLAVGRFIVSDGDLVQVYIEDDRVTVKGTRGQKVDASKGQDPVFTGDFSAYADGAGLSYYMVRDAPAGEYRVFFKVIKHQPSDSPIRGFVTVEVQGKFDVTPPLTASQAHTVIPIAVVTTDADHNQTIRMVVPKEATVPQTAPPPSPPADAGKK